MRAAVGEVDPRERALFDALDVTGAGRLTRRDLVDALEYVGLSLRDPRLRAISEGMARGVGMDVVAFCDRIRPSLHLVERALRGELIIPEFASFCREIREIYDGVARERGGEVADYIPQLARVDPEQFAVSICTVDGQRLDLGDSDVGFCVQSVCKPVNYCIALEEIGEDGVHRRVGREPSGRGFNELTLDLQGKPHNPLINAGAIACCAMIRPSASIADRFDHVVSVWRRLAAGRKPGFSNPTYLSERETADRNFALGYMMRERGVFPAGTDLVETLEFYFQCCSLEVDSEQMTTVAATLAHGGLNPLTGERVFAADTVRRCLSLMQSCGMYDFSGEFAFAIGLPAKSGVSGSVMLVVPNVMGVCIWSPRLDRHGNSVRAIQFCQKLVERFALHPFDDLTGLSSKRDPRRSNVAADIDQTAPLIWAASKGDLPAVQREIARGASPSAGDYDLRTPLHLAAAEGHRDVVRYLLAHGADPVARDRFGHVPLDDARRHDHPEVVQILLRASPEDSGSGPPAPETSSIPVRAGSGPSA